MYTGICPVCGAASSLQKETLVFTAVYAGTQASEDLPVMVCSHCGAHFDIDKTDDELRKKAMQSARNNSVSKTLSKLEEEFSFTDIERSFSLPPKTLSKWKTQSKTPSAAAAAFVSLLGVFPWLSYVGMTDYVPDIAYKIAGAAFFRRATEDERIKAFYLSNDIYEAIGLVNDKTVNNNMVPINSEFIDKGAYASQ